MFGGIDVGRFVTVQSVGLDISVQVWVAPSGFDLWLETVRRRDSLLEFIVKGRVVSVHAHLAVVR